MMMLTMISRVANTPLIRDSNRIRAAKRSMTASGSSADLQGLYDDLLAARNLVGEGAVGALVGDFTPLVGLLFGHGDDLDTRLREGSDQFVVELLGFGREVVFGLLGGIHDRLLLGVVQLVEAAL